MKMFRTLAMAGLLVAASATMPIVTAPAAAAAVDNTDPSRFIETLSAEAFRVLKTGSKTSSRGQFRQLLGQYFAINEIGDKLIARERSQITPAQYQAYQAALPGFLIGTYADRLYDYSDAKVTVTRSVPRGSGAAVVSQVVRPGQSPANAIWSVENQGGYKITNLTVAGINLVLTQTADFNAYVQKNGFDKLIAFMRSRSS